MPKYEVTIRERKNSLFVPEGADWAEIDGQKMHYSVHTFDAHTTYVRVGLRLYRIDNVTNHGRDVEFSVDGRMVTGEVLDEQSLLMQKLGFKPSSGHTDGLLLSPMPGKILELLVEVGQEVEKDQPLVILEAMKMENELKAPSDGTISEIHVKTAQNVEKKQQILTILPRG